VLFVSKDPGGVQAILPVLKGLGPRSVVASHRLSRHLYEAEGLETITLEALGYQEDPDTALAKLLERHRPRLVVTGTSVRSPQEEATPEQRLVGVARSRGVATLSVLDTWGHYRARYASADGSLRTDWLPDVLCVLDEAAKNELARMGVPEQRLVVTHNPHYDRVVRGVEVGPDPPSSQIRPGWRNILFVSQPLDEYATSTPAEPPQQALFRALDEELSVWDSARARQVIVWLHPKESPEGWEEVLSRASAGTMACLGRDRGAAVLAHVDFLVTSHSTVAYEALYWGTPCISFQLEGSGQRLVSDALGLSVHAPSRGGLRKVLEDRDFGAERRRLLERRQQLGSEGIFFSDGRATQRVLGVIESLTP
jgi:hypothetical protein